MIPLPDVNRNGVPEIGTADREEQERECLARASELIHENDGRLRDALWDMEQELLGPLHHREFAQATRDYARALCQHVEQCWATAIVR